ncbi:MAG: hypothetical protein EXR21_02205 [Flavobacteriaceae bacterium]|nr:hypothetical protein [Flavobacteriaceae bacterium]
MKYLSTFIIAACVLVLSPTTAFAQAPTPYVLNTAGATFSNPSWQADISIGEPIITTFSNPTNILTQASLQLELAKNKKKATQRLPFSIIQYSLSQTEND